MGKTPLTTAGKQLVNTVQLIALHDACNGTEVEARREKKKTVQ
jgi:hypothetical protein